MKEGVWDWEREANQLISHMCKWSFDNG